MRKENTRESALRIELRRLRSRKERLDNNQPRPRTLDHELWASSCDIVQKRIDELVRELGTIPMFVGGP